jgi:hypothetical protein
MLARGEQVAFRRRNLPLDPQSESPLTRVSCFEQPWKENYLEELTGGRAKADMTFEQYLQFAASWARRNSERTHNLCVVNCTTPAQYFHVLRRQIHRPYVKPLILMSPKYMLHHRACRSPIEAMEPGTFFYRVIIEGTRGDNMAKKGYELVPNDEVGMGIFPSSSICAVLACPLELHPLFCIASSCQIGWISPTLSLSALCGKKERGR